VPIVMMLDGLSLELPELQEFLTLQSLTRQKASNLKSPNNQLNTQNQKKGANSKPGTQPKKKRA
jgi:hypothetical protein